MWVGRQGGGTRRTSACVAIRERLPHALAVIWAVVVAVTDVAGALIAAPNVAAQFIAAATIAVIGAVMLLTDVSDGIVAPMTGLSDCGNGDRADGSD